VPHGGNNVAIDAGISDAQVCRRRKGDAVVSSFSGGTVERRKTRAQGVAHFRLRNTPRCRVQEWRPNRVLLHLIAASFLAVIGNSTKTAAQEPAEAKARAPAVRPGAERNIVNPGAESVGKNGFVLSAPWESVLRKEYPDLDCERFVAFFEQNNPMILKQVFSETPGSNQNIQPELETVIKRYFLLEHLRLQNLEEYRRELAIEQLECQSLRLADQLQRLEKRLAENTGDRQTDQAQLDRTSAQLKELLPQIFAAKQENQLIEINRLEAEMREIRNQLELREANKADIVRNRYYVLTGEDGYSPALPLPGLRSSSPSHESAPW